MAPPLVPPAQEAPGKPLWSAKAQSEDEPLGSPKQFIGLSKLDAKEKSFRYLDFAEGGTNAALNKWGQFLQFSRLVVGGGDPDSWNYISVEPRSIFRLEHIAPAQSSHEQEPEEEDEEGMGGVSENNRRTPRWEQDNQEWKPNAFCFSNYPAYPRRHDKFNALCMQNQGLGLRFSDSTNLSDLEHYYRNDRWPEVHYTVEGKVKVVLQYYIRNDEIIQDMRLTSESDKETELNLEFEFTTGIRIARGDVNQLKVREEDFPVHFLQRVPEGEVLGSHWKIRGGNYYATASLFEDGKPKPLSLLGDGEQGDMIECSLDILSDDPIRYRETFKLKSNASVKFTSVFKLDHKNAPSTLPGYFDISPELKLFDDRWWSFKTESSSFVFRRNLETILSHAMPLPWVEGEDYQPYVLHDHDLVNTYQTWSSSLNQTLYLLEIDKILQRQDTADEVTKLYYRKRIQKVIFGYFVWLLRLAERNGFPETDILHWSGKLALPTETGETEGGVGEVTEEAGASSDPPPLRPFEPELSKYEDKFRNCCQFLVLLGMCLINYPGEADLLTRMVEAFLKLAWEPIELSKHPWSRLWPDLSETTGEYPPPYARFQNRQDPANGGYGGQGTYVYVITTQVTVWRAVRSVKRLLNLVSNGPSWSEWMAHQSLDDKAIRDRTIEAFRSHGIDASQNPSPEHFVSKIKGHIRESFPNQWSYDIVIPSLVEDFFLDGKNETICAWVETLRYYGKSSNSPKARTPDIWESFMRYQLAIGSDRRQALRVAFEERAYSIGLFPGGAVTLDSHCPYSTPWELVTYFLSEDHTGLLYPQFKIPIASDPKIMDPLTSADSEQGSKPPQEGLMSAGTNPGAISGGVRLEGRKSGNKGKSLDLTAEDRRQVNDPPSYGEWCWFREPLFMKHKLKPFEMNKKFIEDFLHLENNWSYFWETGQGMSNFIENMADMTDYDWGAHKNTLIQPFRSKEPRFFSGGDVLPRLWEQV
ncbi:unnamed protein product [Tuber aestivum]|uniref:Uncharacterized protein n=1 Tax=Tuber aestivum TaxID=59557 RepID=A0A292Q6J0_9PEZI|nr:unnamed protein product [Tuber aestivum]